MPTTQQLREQRANIWEQMKEIMEPAQADSRSSLSAEETQKYDRLEVDLDAIEDQITRAEKFDARSAAMDKVDRTGVVPDQRAAGQEDETSDARYERIFRSYLRSGRDELDREERQILNGSFVADSEARAAGVGTGAAGGFAVPLAFRNVFIETMKWFGPMLDVAETITTDSGVNLPWPTNDDTGNVGAILAENTQVAEQDVTLGTNSLDAYMYTSKLVRASYQLLQDRPDFDTWLARKLGERVGRILNQHFTTGTGTAQPDGIVTSATVGVTGTGSLASTGGVSYANTVDVVESLDPAYGNGNGLQWMMHQSARKAFRKLVDGQGRPLWDVDVTGQFPNTLQGYPVIINNDMPTLATSSKSVLFGNIREAYAIRLVSGLTTARLTERYADFLQVGFLAFQRADGTMQNANAVRVFQTTATA